MNLPQSTCWRLTGNLLGTISALCVPVCQTGLLWDRLQGHPLRTEPADPDHTQRSLQLRHETTAGSAYTSQTNNLRLTVYNQPLNGWYYIRRSLVNDFLRLKGQFSTLINKTAQRTRLNLDGKSGIGQLEKIRIEWCLDDIPAVVFCSRILPSEPRHPKGRPLD